MFSRDTLWDLVFPHFMLIYVEKARFWDSPKKSNGFFRVPKSHFFNINQHKQFPGSSKKASLK